MLKSYPKVKPKIKVNAYNISESIFEDVGFLLATDSKFGHKTFERYAVSNYNIRVLSTADATKHLQAGGRLLVNGYGSVVQGLVKQYPQQIFAIWHSTITGAGFMGENGILLNAIKDAANGDVTILLLSEFDELPKNWIRLKQFIPRDATYNYYESNGQQQSDVVLPIGGTITVPLKNTYKLIYDCFSYGVSFAGSRDVVLLHTKEFNTAFSQNITPQIAPTSFPLSQDFFRSGRLYVCGSIADTMPYTVLESLQAGVPVLVSPNVGWASVFDEIRELCVFPAHELIRVAKILSKDTLALKKLFYKQADLVNKAADIWFRHNQSVIFTPKIAYYIEGVSDVYPIHFETKTSCVYRLQCDQNLSEIACVLARLFDSGLKINHIKLTLVLDKTSTLGFELEIDHSKNQMRSEAATNKAFRELVDSSLKGVARCAANFLYKLCLLKLDWVSLVVPESIVHQIAESSLFIIDVVGWAFHNISKQVAKYSKTPIIIAPEALIQCLADRTKSKLQPQQCIYFWFPTRLRFGSLIEARQHILTIYDHYSFKAYHELFKSCAAVSDAVFVGNDKLGIEVRSLELNLPIYVVKDGVDSIKFQGSAPPQEVFTVGWVGKGMKDLWSNVQDVKGIGLVRQLAEHYANDASVRIHIHDTDNDEMIPHADMFERFYSKIDCLICVSEAEGTPNPIFEAWASGVFVLSTNVGNVADIMIEGLNGLFVERSLESLTKAIEHTRTLSTDKDLIRKSVQSFDWSLKVHAWLYALKATTQVKKG